MNTVEMPLDFYGIPDTISINTIKPAINPQNIRISYQLDADSRLGGSKNTNKRGGNANVV